MSGTGESMSGRCYRHYKGTVYRILTEAKHSETHEPLVIYMDTTDNSKIWARPKEMFFEDVTIEGVHQKRFTPVDDVDEGSIWRRLFRRS